MEFWRLMGLVSIVLALAGWAAARRSPSASIPRRIVIPGVAIAFANLGALGVLIGQDGASRAFGTGMHTLFRDHLVAVVIATAIALALGAVAGRLLTTRGEAWRLVLAVLLGDVLAAALVDLAYGEITLIFLPWSIAVETIFGAQLVAAGAGALLGLGWAGRARRARPSEAA
jgi:hypothetical protein